ncbi:MAG: 50S ribosomal protein L4 [Armatimonadota bacterium]
MEIQVVDASGKKKGTHKLSEALTEVRVLAPVLHRAVVAEQANKRQGTQSTKSRAEVRGGGRKPYRQKKTGRARQGSVRAPQYTHGGVTHAPKPRPYDQKVNRKERRLAILGALKSRFESGDVIVVDSISFDAPKTKQAVQLLDSVGATARRVLVVVPEVQEAVVRSFRNLRNDPRRRVEVRTAPASVSRGDERVRTQSFSARDVLVAHKIVITQEALKRIEEVWSR